MQDYNFLYKSWKLIFASGALRASYWAASAEPGFYSLADVLDNGG